MNDNFIFVEGFTDVGVVWTESLQFLIIYEYLMQKLISQHETISVCAYYLVRLYNEKVMLIKKYANNTTHWRLIVP